MAQAIPTLPPTLQGRFDTALNSLAAERHASTAVAAAADRAFQTSLRWALHGLNMAPATQARSVQLQPNTPFASECLHACGWLAGP